MLINDNDIQLNNALDSSVLVWVDGHDNKLLSYQSILEADFTMLVLQSPFSLLYELGH